MTDTTPTTEPTTEPKGATTPPTECPECHHVGTHGRVMVHGPPWNPWAYEDLGPCPRGR